jgi:hypothetical protein
MAPHTTHRLRQKFVDWLLRDVHLKDTHFGDGSITLSPAGVGDVTRWSATKLAAQLGDIGMDLATGRPSTFVGGSPNPVAVLSDLTNASILSGTYAARPAPGTKNRIYVSTDSGILLFFDDGTAWRPLIDGITGTETAPSGSTAAYTFTNTSSNGQFFQTAGVATLRSLGGGGSDAINMADAPRSAGQSIVAALRGYMLPTQDGAFCSFGIHLRNPTTGAIILLAVTLSTLTSPNYGGNLLQGEIYTNATTFSSRYFNLRSFGYGTLGTIWMRMIESGGNYTFGFSLDGRNFESAGGPAIAAGNTQAGFFVNANSLTGAVDALSLFIG